MNIKKLNILIIASSAILLGSCSSAYRAGQTPDDLYYSAPKEVVAYGDEEYLTVNNGKERYSRNNRMQEYNDYGYDAPYSYPSGYYPSAFNNYYWNNWSYNYGMFGFLPSFSFGGLYGGWGLNMGSGYYNSLMNPWSSWNSLYYPYSYNPYGYNPYGYYYPGTLSNGKTPIYRNTARPMVFNPAAYSNRNNINISQRSYTNPRTGTGRYNNNNANTRTIPNSSNNNRRQADSYYNNNSSGNNAPNRTYDGRPQRTYTPSSTPSYNPPARSSGGGNNGGGGEIRRPTRNR